MSFAVDIRKAAKAMEQSLEDVSYAIVQELFSSVVLDTPVDTGRARGNWQVSVGQGVYGTIDRLSKDGSVVLEDIGKVKVKLGESYHLSNNLPYIQRLEYDGWSDQAQNGMVRVNLARVVGNLNSIIKGARR